MAYKNTRTDVTSLMTLIKLRSFVSIRYEVLTTVTLKKYVSQYSPANTFRV